MGLFNKLKEQALSVTNELLGSQQTEDQQKYPAQQAPPVPQQAPPMPQQYPQQTPPMPQQFSQQAPPMPQQFSQQAPPMPQQYPQQAPPMPQQSPGAGTQIYDAGLEGFIEMALADGELTEKEKQILYKKAQARGIDLDEFEMVLEAKLFEKRKSMQAAMPQPQAATPKSNKYGDVRKCPGCGAVVESFNIRCPDCGFEFTNVGAVSSFEALSRKLEEIDRKYSKDYSEGGVFKQTFGSMTRFQDEARIIKMKQQAVSTFPIPTAKEDLLEFLAMGIPMAEKKGSRLTRNNVGSPDYEHNQLANAWHNKLKQVVIKARLAMKNDPSTLEDIERYAKELGL
jgi:hypothetical protein